jgi:hypothetical protein
VSKKSGELYQKTEDTNKLILLAYKIIAILHNTLYHTPLIWRRQAPDQGSTVDVFLFSRLKSIMKGARFADAGARRRQIRGVRWVDFFLFLRLKSIMKGASFADVAAIQKCMTAILRSIPKEAFADSFQKLYTRCQQCVLNDGDYLKGQ